MADLALVRSNLPTSGVAGEKPPAKRSPAGRSEVPVRLGPANPKTRNRIMAGALLMFVLVTVAAAPGQ